MERTRVISSSISEVGYDGASVLEIKFSRGAIFQYFDVPHSKVFEMMTSESIGRYFAMNIKDQFKCKKIEG